MTIYRTFAFAMLVPAACFGQVPAYTISTVIGNGTSGYTADGTVTGTSAQLGSPFQFGLDSSGALFITDQVNHRIRKFSGSSLSTVAGNGTSGFAGDSKSATDSNTEIGTAEGLVLDSSGNFYIGDTSNCVVRKVAGGTISTFAGKGQTCGWSGDLAAATAATLNQPSSLARDAAGNLYIADTKNHLIRKVDTSGNITTIAGKGTADFGGDGGPAIYAQVNNPQGIALDAAGNLYIADSGNHRIRLITTDGNIQTIVGDGVPRFAGDGGPAVLASLNNPKGVAVDASGNVFVTDTYNHRIRVVTGGVIFSIAGQIAGYAGDGGPATSAMLRGPLAPLVSAGKVYFSDNQNSTIRVLTPMAGTNPPAIKAGGAVTATQFGGAAAAAPGSWIEIYGTNLASATQSWAASDFRGPNAPTTLAGTRVSIGGVPAYVSYVSPTQVNVQVPAGVGTGSQAIVVSTTGGISAAGSITINATQPALLAPGSMAPGGKQYVVAILPDGSYAAPAGSIAGVQSRPAKPGEIVTLYGVGFGPVASNAAAGLIANANADNTLQTVLSVQIGNATAAVQYAGLAPGLVGLYQINVVMPDVPASNATPLTFALGGQAGTQSLAIATGQ